MLGFFSSLRDHRGRKVPLYAPGPRSIERSDFPDAEFNLLRKRLRESSVLELLLTPLILFSIAALFTIGLISRISRVGVAGAFWSAVFAIPVIAGAIVVRRRLPPASPRQVAAALLDLGRCPSCAFKLSPTPIEPDRCVVCPECGSAWILPYDIFENSPSAAGETPAPARGPLPKSENSPEVPSVSAHIKPENFGRQTPPPRVE